MDVLDRAQALLLLDNTTGHLTQQREDVRRAALVMGLAALDTYLHWTIRQVDLAAMSPSLKKVKIQFGELVKSGQKSIASRKAGIADRPQTRARNVLNEHLLTLTFQSAEQVQTALSLAGVAKAFEQLAAAMVPSSTPSEVKEKLNSLSHRRNKIAHEGDLTRLLRPQRITRETIARQDVDNDLVWIRRFLDALQIVVP
jgi:hypothetical protein